MKLSIMAELVYTFAEATQVIACLEASHSADQTVLSESLDVRLPVPLLRDTSLSGDRRVRASLSGQTTIRYEATVENNLRQLLPRSGTNISGQNCRMTCCHFCCRAAFARPINLCGSFNANSQAQGTAWPVSWQSWNGSTAMSTTCPGQPTLQDNQLMSKHRVLS
jgi:hypothetical protein